MPQIKGTYATENASKYLQQLCKHLAHKIDVDYTATDGQAQFPFGTAVLSASESTLTVTCDVSDAQSIATLHHVIDSHLAKFAFREDFEHMDWT